MARIVFCCVFLLHSLNAQITFNITPKEFKPTDAKYPLPKSPKTLVVKISARYKEELREKFKLLESTFVGTNYGIRIQPIKTPGDIRLIIIGNMDYEPRRFEIPPQAEGYLLEVTSRGVLLMAKDFMGIQWGILRLKEAINIKEEYIPAFLIHDWPDLLWRGVHLPLPEEAQLNAFKKFIIEIFLPYQFNTICLQTDYNFEFEKLKEFRTERARSAGFCRELSSFLVDHGIRVIPAFNCLGHQSAAQTNYPLLKAYPEFDETPYLPFGDKRLYRRSWCPRNRKLPPLLFDMWGDMVTAFESSYFHIGMNEVFHIADARCPHCMYSSPWEIFSFAAAQYHAYFSGKENVVLMWADRLLPGDKFGYSKYESSHNNTAKALSFLPRDIILCDWHTEVQKTYSSLPYLQKEGFRVLACPAMKKQSITSMWQYSKQKGVRTNLFLGFLGRTDLDFKTINAVFVKDEYSREAEETAACIQLLGKLCWQGTR